MVDLQRTLNPVVTAKEGILEWPLRVSGPLGSQTEVRDLEEGLSAQGKQRGAVTAQISTVSGDESELLCL